MQEQLVTENAGVRWGGIHELDWVNDLYRNIDFKPSKLESDQVAIAEWDGERIGIGRLCRIEETIYELGGMHVFPSHRGKGIARQIVRFLLSSLDTHDQIFCLPFAHLRQFYSSEGFEIVCGSELALVPLELREKYTWCNEVYPHEVLMMKHKAL